MTDLTTLEGLATGAADPSIPAPGPNAPYSGAGPTPQWSDAYQEVLARADRVRRDAEAVTGDAGQAITYEIQAYIGALLTVMSTYVNDLNFDRETEINTLTNYLIPREQQLDNELTFIDANVGHLTANDYELRQQILPALLTQIANLEQEIKVTQLQTEAALQQWADDTIYKPLEEEMVLREEGQKQYTDQVATVLHTDTTQQVEQERLERVAAVLLLQQSVTTLETEQVDCTEPMCSVMGPKTDLGKLLKALSIAEGLAFFTYLASLDGAGVERLIGSVESDVSGVVRDIASIFTGGETVGSAIGDIVLG